MSPEPLIPVFLFLAVTGMVLALTSLTGRAQSRVTARISALAGEAPAESVPAAAFRVAADATAPADGAKPNRLRERLTHAGYYRPEAERTFQSIRLGGVVAAWVTGLLAVLADLVSLESGAFGAAGLSAVALVVPGMWLDNRKAARQREFKKALPDFFDMLVLCLESGLALPAAWRQVGGEMKDAYPVLYGELRLAEREMDLGGVLGDAIRRCAARTALDELSGLASVVGQAERLGTGLAKPLRVLSDALRVQRVQKAEELAHKSATKIMFPTLLFIFPGVFAIILGPMAIQVMNLFGGAK
jgi:tight adherence protein C